jgi:succinate-acetate transporter protein
MATVEQTEAPARSVTSGGFADPAPLGLGAFAMTTFFLSSVNTGWLSPSVTGIVFGLAVFVGGLLQLIAGVWEFAKGNTFGAVAFCSFGGFWLSFWLLGHTALTGATPQDAGNGVGFYLVGWAIFTTYMFLSSFKTSLVTMAVFLALAVTFVLLAIGSFHMDAAGQGMTRMGGILGIITAALAWYGSFAGVANGTSKRTILPTFPRS